MKRTATTSNPGIVTQSLSVSIDDTAGYRIVSKLGEGGSARVYLAEYRPGCGVIRHSALKVFKESQIQDIERFVTEARIMAGIRHPNVVACHDLGLERSRGAFFLSLEYVDGRSLRSVLDRCSRRGLRLPIEFASEIAIDLALGLRAAHEAAPLLEDDEGQVVRPMPRLVHRDLKPANILISSEGLAKISDFGLAGSSLGRDGIQGNEGTVRYSTPEHWQRQPLTQRSDQFSFGLVLYELLTGKSLYQLTDGNIANLVFQLCRGPSMQQLVSVDRVARGIGGILRKCVDPDPQLRFPSTRDLVIALRRCLRNRLGYIADDTAWNMLVHPDDFVESDVNGLIDPAPGLCRFLRTYIRPDDEDDRTGTFVAMDEEEPYSPGAFVRSVRATSSEDLAAISLSDGGLYVGELDGLEEESHVSVWKRAIEDARERWGQYLGRRSGSGPRPALGDSDR